MEAAKPPPFKKRGFNRMAIAAPPGAPEKLSEKVAVQREIPKRFQPSRAVLFVDRWMTHFIKIGGVSIIAAVLGIFVFILSQILPLFKGAEVKEVKSVNLPKNDYQIVGVDEWGELPFFIDSHGQILFLDLGGKGGIIQADPGFSEPKTFSAFSYSPLRQDIIFGTFDGYISLVQVNYSSDFQGNLRSIKQDVKASPFIHAGIEGYPIVQVGYGDSGTDKLIAIIQEVEGKREVHAVTLTQERTLFGVGEIVPGKSFDLTSLISGQPEYLAVNQQASDIVVAMETGEVYYFYRSGDEIELRQVFQPFADQKSKKVASLEFLFGGVSLVSTNPQGINRIFSLYEKEGDDKRTYNQTKEFPALNGPADFYAMSIRNKAFLIGNGSQASLRYGTTADVRWEQKLPFEATAAVLGGKYNSMYLLDKNSKLHIYSLNDPHPESSFAALFGKIWYEGASEPGYEWQSTGGSDDFEPKLSLVPLIIGTLKGTFYAMLFAIPIALLAAIYTSQFLLPKFRLLIKPTMEIMASLPSVVLGFLAALWLAPILETKVPAIILLLIIVPSVSLLIGWLWGFLPVQIRVLVKPGYEWIAFMPVLFLVAYIGWNLGPVLERMLFAVTDPTTGKVVADFRAWWTQSTSLPYEQRNSLVVGFMMGFAVIPIIFTITEDALSNVPGALRSGSLALGASRWQTALRIVLPTASAGIFSAIMIGLGRAVGETMIVVMATGNTPIMDFNIFSGMRTLSANIAVELPEAPVHGTLYRTLFLGALALFILTFVVNTLAEVLRQHLREKYKTV
jgi:phosphate transport system permease protein